MAQSNIDYAHLMHSAMRGLIRDVLARIQREGLPGEHHFFITFDTMHPDVEIADWLSDRYPGEMTVVLQHWYDGLEVGEDGFAITLNFGETPEPLYIPFDALRTFVDPSVEFGLRFESPAESDAEGEADMVEVGEETGPSGEEEEKGEAEVVSLDRFRK